MSTIFTDADLRADVLNFLSAGDSPDDFDVDGIVGDVQRRFGAVALDTIAPDVFLSIVQSHDISAVTVRPELAAVYEQISRLYRKHAELPGPWSATLQVRIASRAELDALAGDFGRPAPEKADIYDGAQFSVDLPYDGPRVTVIFWWRGDL